MLESMIRFTVRNPAVTLVLTLAVAVFGWQAWTEKSVDAIPDVSENQVVVVARWPGRSPQDVEDQVTYPLATELASVRNVKEVRSLSGFGFSQIYVVFDEPLRLLPSGAIDDFYEARTRVLEKLAAVADILPEGVTPELGPDATALGQIFMYTVDGPYDLATLRSVQDFVVRWELQRVSGVAEVAGVGGMLRQYQVDLDPDALRHWGVTPGQVAAAIRRANADVGAKTIEAGGAEYLLRGLGFIKGIADIEEVTVGHMTSSGFAPAAAAGMAGMAEMGGGSGAMAPAAMSAPDANEPHRPVLIRDIGRVALGPEFRRSALADGSGELVGGIVAMRFGANPREVIDGLRESVLRLNDPANGLLPEGVRIHPFYDRSQLIEETITTLEEALSHELIITILIVLLFLAHIRSSLIIAATLPLAVAGAFLSMRVLGLDSNIMSLTGIAIAIGTMVDMAIVMTENIVRRVEDEGGSRPVAAIIEDAAVEVAPALLTAVSTTIISFLPIYFLTDMEGKLFRPLAWTKSLALAMAALSGILVVPVLCRLFLVARPSSEGRGRLYSRLLGGLLAGLIGFWAARAEVFGLTTVPAFLLFGLGSYLILRRAAAEARPSAGRNPLTRAIHRGYEPMLRWVLAHKMLFMTGPLLILAFGLLVTFGGERGLAPVTDALPSLKKARPVAWLSETFPGLGTEFMPALDEGSLLYMPSLLPQASLSQTLEVMRRQNAMIESVPEVARVVGKLGRAETALDPAPVGMIETVVALHPRSEWRAGLSREELVSELMRKTHTPGVLEGAGAWIQPIETRVIMLNAGIRAPLAVKLIGAPRDEEGRTLDARTGVGLLETLATRIRERIARVAGVAGPNVENLGGKIYVEFRIDREKVGHHGLTIGDVQDVLMTAVGGMEVARTVEGRERFSIRVAYDRERRDRLDELDRILVQSADGELLPIGSLAEIEIAPGPAAIKTEDGLLRLHVTFAASGRDEGRVMEDVLAEIAAWRAEERDAGRADPIPTGVAIEAAGRYESQLRASKRFAILIPVCVLLIFFLIYLNFRDWAMCLNVFAAVPICVAGGLILLAFFPDLKDFMYEVGLWDRPSSGPIHVTVAVVVGFIALAGIATDDGVVIATYMKQSFAAHQPTSVAEIREAVVEAGLRRIRPCLMTTATTVIALYPILAATGRGSDVAQPMAIPSVGGMITSLVTLFIVPLVFCWIEELRLKYAADASS